MRRLPKMCVALAVLAAACDGGEGAGDDASDGPPTTAAPTSFEVVATAEVDIAAPEFSGRRQFEQDPTRPSSVALDEQTVQLYLRDASSEPGLDRVLSIGGGVKPGGTVVSGDTLQVTYVAEGQVAQDTGGGCAVTIDRLDARGVAGRLSCERLDLAGNPLVLGATFSGAPVAPPRASSTSSSTTPPG